MSNLIQIIINQHADRNAIQAVIDETSHYYVDVINNCQEGESVSVLDLVDLDATNLEAFYKVVDQATYLYEQSAYVFRIDKVDHAFELTNSYIRDVIDSSDVSGMINGQPLKMKVEIPGFSGTNSREIDLWYNEEFNPTDLDLLAEIGVELVGDGSSFVLNNSIECMVTFSRPSAITDLYAIDFPLQSEVIIPNV
jgi:hypothetical protein